MAREKFNKRSKRDPGREGIRAAVRATEGSEHATPPPSVREFLRRLALTPEARETEDFTRKVGGIFAGTVEGPMLVPGIRGAKGS